jgi:hypothetical protein
MIQLEKKSTISQELLKRQKLHVLYMICHVKVTTLIWPSIAGLSTTEDIMRSNMFLGTLNLHIAEIACIVHVYDAT